MLTTMISRPALRHCGAALLATTALASASAVSAQTAAAAPASALPSGSSAGSGPGAAQNASADIIVTATKRSERLQDVPISIQALGTQTLEQHQVTNFDDYAKLLPSVSYQSFGPSQAQLYFRGIASGGDGARVGSTPTTGLYLDETPVTTIATAVDIHIYDINRVEALAGPQGTLFGASSLSGTLRIITNKPDPSKFSAGYDLEGNKFGKGGYGGQAEGFVNIPLTDRAAIRLVGYYQHDGGYIDNTNTGNRCYNRFNDFGFDSGTTCNPGDVAPPGTTPAPLTVNNKDFVKKNFNDVNSYGGRATLAYDIDDNWTVTPGIIYQHQVAHGSFLYDPRAGDLEVHDFSAEKNLDRFYLASLTIQGKLSDWDVTYAGSYFQRTIDNHADYSYFTVAYDRNGAVDYNFFQTADGHIIDPTQQFHGNDKFTKLSQELRVSSPAGDRFRLTAGMFLQRQTDLITAEYIIPGASTSAYPEVDPPVPGADGPDDVYFTKVHRADRDYAAFGEAAYDIVPGVTLNAGIRGFITNNSLKGFSGGVFSFSDDCAVQTVQACPDVDKRKVQTGETHKVNLTWKIDRDHMIYATYSTGFRPGGNNRTPGIPPFDADTLTNYEVGWKTSWLDHHLRINGALFLEKWDKLQYALPGFLAIFSTYNAGKAQTKGIEGDASLRLGGLTLSTAGTYVRAKLTTDFCDVANGCDPANGGELLAPKGTRLPITPRLKINATARYDVPIGDFKSFVQGSVQHQSGTTSYLETEGESEIGPTSGFTTFDFSAGATVGSLSFSAFIQNAFDKRGILAKGSDCSSNYCYVYSRLYPTKPQFFGVRVGQKF